MMWGAKGGIIQCYKVGHRVVPECVRWAEEPVRKVRLKASSPGYNMPFSVKHCAWFRFGIKVVCVLFYCISDAWLVMR